MDFGVPADHRVKLKKGEKKDKCLDLARELKKLWNMKVTVISTVIGALSSHQRIGIGIGRLEGKRTSGDHPNSSIVEIDQNTKESPGDLKRLTDTQTPVENDQLTLV